MSESVNSKQCYALCVEYQGSQYHGWQIQDDVSSVQAHVEQALSFVANEPIQVFCSGRTDSGVHASYQIIHFKSAAARSLDAWVRGTNTQLPEDIAIKWAQPVADDFHARFSALKRRYRYLIFSANTKPAILPKGVTWIYKELDIERMNQAAQYLIGEHNFNAYRAINCQAHSPVRTIDKLDVYRQGSLIVIDVSANAFLQHMVRNIAGVLMKIGANEADPIWAQQVLQSEDRRQGGVTAPPYGLYFVDVQYPEKYSLPKSDIGPYFLPWLG